MYNAYTLPNMNDIIPLTLGCICKKRIMQKPEELEEVDKPLPGVLPQGEPQQPPCIADDSRIEGSPADRLQLPQGNVNEPQPLDPHSNVADSGEPSISPGEGEMLPYGIPETVPGKQT